jgi:hypothetical protein
VLGASGFEEFAANMAGAKVALIRRVVKQSSGRRIW